jgi:ferredoxin--NADP+ reductase
MESGKLTRDLHLPELSAEHDRFMLCGSPELLKDLRGVFDKLRLTEGNMSHPGHYVIERAFVEK